MRLGMGLLEWLRLPSRAEQAEEAEWEALWKEVGYQPNPRMVFNMLGPMRYPGEPSPTLRERLGLWPRRTK